MKRLNPDSAGIRMLLILLLLPCEIFTKTFAQGTWSADLPTVGTFSSPRIADLNNDGIGDVIIGAGRREFITCDTAIVALDGKTGKILWKRPAVDQMFGSNGLVRRRRARNDAGRKGSAQG